MKDIVIFEDGKSARGSRAKLIKRGNKRVLIEFLKYDYDLDKDFTVIEWFKVHNPKWNRNSINKRNNKRKHAWYYHEETNEFYSDYHQTETYRLKAKEYFTEEYYNSLFGE